MLDISKLDGVILYEGPSLIQPNVNIVAIATGLRKKTANKKTGAEVQTWILLADVDPYTALGTGADSAICGGCPKRAQETNVPRVGKDKQGNRREYLGFAKRACYVRPQSFGGIWNAYKRGRYPKLPTSQLADVFAGKVVRLGSYGDPAAVPLAVWQIVTSKSVGHTGYTHQWKSARLRGVTSLCQASVDTPEEADKAEALGLGYFRVKQADEPVREGEVVCPASAERSYVSDCASCRMCDGHSGKRVVINAHGTGAQFVRTSRQLNVMA